jgi:hypothetical protein
MNDPNELNNENSLPLETAAELQDHLLMASNDLDRLQRLLNDACMELFAGFNSACEHIEKLHSMTGIVGQESDAAIVQLSKAITALQFQDMATQLIAHTHVRLRNCADTLANETFGNDDEDGAAVVMPAPLKPNPVTQDEMDAGSIELF